MIWASSSGRITLKITLAEARYGCSMGKCDHAIHSLRYRNPSIRRQMVKLDPDTVRHELSELGAWSVDESADESENLKRILWIACGDIKEEHA